MERYAYSLAPVAAVSLLQFFTLALGGRRNGLALYCLSVGLWALSLLLSFVPETAEVASRLAASGAFVSAAFLHAAYDLTGQTRYRLVGFAYAAAAVLFGLGFLQPGWLYDPVTLARGPWFWHGMALAVVAALVPLWHLLRAPDPLRWRLALSGALCYAGAWTNATLLAGGEHAPWGLYAVLASLLVLTRVVAASERPGARRLLERSLGYSALAAALGAGFLFGVLALFDDRGALTELGVGGLFLLMMAAVAFEPVRRAAADWLGRRVSPERVPAGEIAAALGEAEARADHAERLAELGVLTSAVAHEVRNPLGVLQGYLRLLERRDDAPRETLAEMEAQVARALRFVDDLLRYGRPRPLEVRRVALRDVIELAWGARDAELVVEGDDPEAEVDAAQLEQSLRVLFDNAVQMGARRVSVRLESSEQASLTVQDDGPGVTEAMSERLFEPFASGRPGGTGLGLPIALRIVERHGGRLNHLPSDAGARFVLVLPLHQPMLPGVEEA